ncbi:uncharacterized protein B0P05DRAFT_584403 [Gilbertella persicaria]|uniref:uncharacterized protein n=1 Tax=Gilbertella persicaria TaxID=101096 RepID=UPI00221FE0FC|nr:uncharacterized protein B0P05DRAFT_584403 [Gilbertella persicaria]KAI8090188.1 hypothetical protein B0P05DRAFT_584403 [Gilbertella persicaria]
MQFAMDSTRYTAESTASSSSPKSTISNYSTSTMEIESYLQFYLVQIQPFFPLFVPSYFNRQYAMHELPRILVYAVCMLAAHFQYPSGEDENYYYQKVMMMLDEAVGRPSIGLVQTLLLLIKYMECKNNFMFFEKSKSLMARTIEVCKILQLHTFQPDTPDAAETKKRTFCMVFACNTLLCVEQGIESDFMSHMYIKEPALLLPSPSSTDDMIEGQRFIISFSFTLSQIHQHILRVTKRQETQQHTRNDSQIIQENMALLHLQAMLDNDFMHLPSHLAYSRHNSSWPFPAAEEDTTVNIPPMTRLVHMLYHLNIIVLHYHYMMHPLPQGSNGDIKSYPHRHMCISAASMMTRLVEGLLLDPVQSFRYAPRGVQFVAHCMTSALTVLRVESMNQDTMTVNKVCFDEYQRCAQLAQRVASVSPSFEMRSYVNDNASTNSSVGTSPSPILQQHTKRRNTISEQTPSFPRTVNYPMVVPQSLLQSSSTDIFHLQPPPYPQYHQPLSNGHAAPLHIQNNNNNNSLRKLRGSTQSCQDLRSMNRLHMSHTGFHRGSSNKSVVSTGSTSSNTTTPYRHYPPYPVNDAVIPVTSQSSGKIRRIKKSMSTHGLSTNYRQQQQQQQQQQSVPMLYTQQPLLNNTSSFLHRPYQPTFDDDIKLTPSTSAMNPIHTVMMDDLSMNMDFDFLYGSNDHYGQRSEGHQLL